jgi:hypothetical protein
MQNYKFDRMKAIDIHTAQQLGFINIKDEKKLAQLGFIRDEKKLEQYRQDQTQQLALQNVVAMGPADINWQKYDQFIEEINERYGEEDDMLKGDPNNKERYRKAMGSVLHPMITSSKTVRIVMNKESAVEAYDYLYGHHAERKTQSTKTQFMEYIPLQGDQEHIYDKLETLKARAEQLDKITESEGAKRTNVQWELSQQNAKRVGLGEGESGENYYDSNNVMDTLLFRHSEFIPEVFFAELAIDILENNIVDDFSEIDFDKHGIKDGIGDLFKDDDTVPASSAWDFWQKYQSFTEKKDKFVEIFLNNDSKKKSNAARYAFMGSNTDMWNNPNAKTKYMESSNKFFGDFSFVAIYGDGHPDGRLQKVMPTSFDEWLQNNYDLNDMVDRFFTFSSGLGGF